MSRVVKKKIKIPLGMKDQDLGEMFNQMLGTGAVNMTIAYPRYVRIRGLVDQLLQVFEMFNKSPFMVRYKEFATEREQIATFLTQSRESFTTLFAMDFTEYQWCLDKVEDDRKKAFSEEYEKMKKSNLINSFIVMCDHLVIYKRYIGDAKNLNPIFITTMPGVEFCPFPFTKLNIKQIFSLNTVAEPTRHFFLVLLNKALELSYKLWGEITSPDIDVDEFVEVIKNNIQEIQKRPELSRCGKAFKKIEESVHLLKSRFNNYYRDFIQTKNSTIMMEHFIIDVSKDTQADPQTTAQFRQIIAFYRKIAQEQIKDPKVKMLFDKVNEQFKELERNTTNLVNVKDDGEDEDDGDSDEEDTETTEADPEIQRAREESANKSIDELVDFIEGGAANVSYGANRGAKKK